MIRRLYLALLRDWIAAQVLINTLADEKKTVDVLKAARELDNGERSRTDGLCQYCYGMANGMICARSAE